MDNKKENLRELIEKFMDPGNAQMYLDDIEAGERILRKYPAPKPDDMLLANIKANIALHKIPQRTVTFRKRVYEALAIAASLIIIAAISFQSFNETPNLPPGTPGNKTGVMQFVFVTQENPEITKINDDIDDINRQITQVAMGPTNYAYDPIPYDQYDKEIKQLEKSLYNIGSNPNEYSYGNSFLQDIEELENRVNEFNNFWQDSYSNSDALEI